jgi:hypothetical protein
LATPADDDPRLRAAGDEADPGLVDQAEQARRAHGADVGLAIRATAAGEDTLVGIAVVAPHARRQTRKLAFRRGSQGQDRAAIATAGVLLETLNAAP